MDPPLWFRAYPWEMYGKLFITTEKNYIYFVLEFDFIGVPFLPFRDYCFKK